MIIAVLTAMAILAYAASNGTPASATPRQQAAPPVRLADDVPPAIPPSAYPLVAPNFERRQPLTITVTLTRTDEAGFQQFLADVQSPSSPNYRHFATQNQLADRFGPSGSAYNAVLSWLRSRGFSLVSGSANRLTIAVRGTRAQAERAFDVTIADYRIGTSLSYANTAAPAVPADLASEIRSVAGLSDMAQPKAPQLDKLPKDVRNSCVLALLILLGAVLTTLFITLLIPFISQFLLDFLVFLNTAGSLSGLGIFANATANCIAGTYNTYFGKGGHGGKKGARDGSSAMPTETVKAPSLGPDQKIGLLEFDTFRPADVSDWLKLVDAQPSIAGRVSKVDVNGGVANPGPGEPEVLLDINAVMSADPAPPTKYVVYDAPSSTSFEQMFNTMINDGDTVISNSWSQCEDNTSMAEAQAIDSVLSQAAASGISVFNGAGDSGSTCLDGSPNTIGVPADSPHATAVGGTTPIFGPALTYGGETPWGSSVRTPSSGSTGFGVSRYFPRPAYQNGLTTSPMRSVPDMAIDADPASGMEICQADAGGCPSGLQYGGTSMSAPELAAIVARVNQDRGGNIGDVNASLYPLAGTNSFHSAASMGSDFAHVGLGSPDFDYITAALNGQAIGPASATQSSAAALSGGPADGTTTATVRVDLLDAKRYPVSGKTVSLVAQGSTHATVSPASGPSRVQGGSVTFAVTDTVPETVTFTASDSTDGVILATQPTVVFVPPAATGASIIASTPVVPNDGTSKATVTVYLQNALGRPAAGKTVSLSAGATNAVISPAGGQAVTAGNGEATFTATDTSIETVLFTAIDVTDGNLPVPGSADVTFEPQGGDSCSNTPPTPASGYSVSRFANGLDYLRQRIIEPGNISAGPCSGPQTPVFDPSGNMYVADTASGKITVFGLSGGSPSTGTELPGTTFAPVFTLGGLVFGKNGELYAGLYNTNGDYFADQIVQLNPATGAIERVLATGSSPGLAPCPGWLAVDPLSGDIFTTDNCSGFLAGGQITRISHPDTTPTVSSYANVGDGATGLSFAPDGTLYVASAGSSTIIALSGTNTAQPGTVTTVASLPNVFGVTVGNVDSHGHATSLYEITYTGTINTIDLTTNPATISTIASGGAFNFSEAVGPDGCLYVDDLDTILKVGGPGLCGAATTTPELTLTGPGVAQPPTGSPVMFTASLNNVPTPAGTPVEFVVSGANSQVKLVNADATGKAVFTYSGVFPGTDTVTAFAVINANTLSSAPVPLRWVAGKDTSFLSLNQSQGGGPLAKPAKLTANLVDLTQTPPTSIANAPITITLGGQSCAATTDTSGNGTCMVTPTGPPGLVPVTATYAGSGTYTPASATNAFAVAGAVAGQAPVITSAASVTFTVGAGGTFTVVVTGSPPPTLAETGTLPTGMTFDPATGILSGTPAAGTVASYPITFTATNGISPDGTQAFTLKVVKANTTTTLTAGPPNPGFGTPVTFTASVAPTTANSLSPTGTVSFFVDGSATPVATVALAGGRASITTSALGAGRHSVVATYAGDANFVSSTSTTPVTETVGCTNTITGEHPGALVVPSGTLCVIGAHVGGSVIVAKGASLDVEGSSIGGAVSAGGGGGSIRICATTTVGAVNVQRMAGLVIVGDPGDAACQPNRIGGSLVLQNNTGGVEAINNTVARLVASKNSGPGPYPGDPTMITGNHG